MSTTLSRAPAPHLLRWETRLRSIGSGPLRSRLRLPRVTGCGLEPLPVDIINFNPGESFSSSDIIQPGVQINAGFQVVSEDRITTTSPATTSIRLYDAIVNDNFVYAARGGPSKTYNAVFANPATNDNGDVVFTADNGSLPAKVLGYLAHGSSTPVQQTDLRRKPQGDDRQ